MVHEFGHQVDFVMATSAREQVAEVYEKKFKNCEKLHPIPPSFEGRSELLRIRSNRPETLYFWLCYAKC